MPVNDFDDETFVAYIDISGFKELMKKRNKAWEALRCFYDIGYEVLKDQNHNSVKVDGFFISDCGVLFSRQIGEQPVSKEKLLLAMLEVVERIFRQMITHNLMLTASVAFGKFKYSGKIEFEGIEKNPIYGGAYVSAYLDHEDGKPKLEPGSCRILKEGVDEAVLSNINRSYSSRLKSNKKHIYFYWMVKDEEEIGLFKSEFHDAYNLKYKGMLDAIKKFSKKNPHPRDM